MIEFYGHQISGGMAHLVDAVQWSDEAVELPESNPENLPHIVKSGVLKYCGFDIAVVLLSDGTCCISEDETRRIIAAIAAKN